MQESPALRKDICGRDYAVLIGLMNRCAKLMHANIDLSHKGAFGETTSIIDRCIFESSVILNWLCANNNKDKFDRYIASGFRTELELKTQIQNAIDKRDGVHLQIEDRMLASVDRHIEQAEFDEEALKNTKQLPDLAAMLVALGKDRIIYTTGQRIGSHHVHGTWVGLRMHYITREENGLFRTRGKTDTHVNQYVYISLIVLETLKSFVRFLFVDSDEETEVVLSLFESIIDEIWEINQEVVGTDFAVAEPES
ncbi:MAG: hypothetical protein HOB17_10235 [Candidatus Marinimicrobia bacterium]|jgi:hypothetical protein|nr:hypothetical protein [Candidatus Neomarinimicrobiota bacterium]MBT3760900.1 hypothetical protein [Candidatus Neomarinimicrobiota bacterium]MBT4538600.1 hypothetical protein [Candidatus Neomarinimicrobiota bacterium]MBT4853037.1 hypothetical protein [Candidatus Neomarinimicrobiota bacterium]MBT5212788.1 hypothetical protein [Candidatus Neomarinimicrobiota bacterium]